MSHCKGVNDMALIIINSKDAINTSKVVEMLAKSQKECSPAK